MNTIPYLQLDCIHTDQNLMKLLPSEIAYRYHALPVASDGNQITVAMASPEDLTASIAVSSAIGAPICLVKADPKEIYQRLDELWQQNPEPKLRILHWSPTSTTAVALDPFTQSLVELLDADLIQVGIPWKGVKSFKDLISVTDQIRPDLTILQSNNPSNLKRILLNKTIHKHIGRLPAVLIIPQTPRWPLEKILLVLPDGDSEDKSAIHWTIQIARSGQSAVTVLPLLPPVPIFYGSFIQYSTKALLTADDPMGQKMRVIGERFKADAINGSFKLRDGEPLDQLSCELLATNPDLVIFASTPHSCLRRWMTGDLFAPLMERTNRPLLISNNIRRA